MVEYLTLADYGKHPSDLVKAVTKTMREESVFMDRLPFPNVGTLSVKVTRETQSLNDVSWRNIGETHGSVKQPKEDEVEEMGYSIGNEVAVDKVYVKDRSKRLVDPMTYQTKMTIRAITRGFNNKSIHGLPTDRKNPVGLHHRIANDLPSTQRINCGGSGLDISADATGYAANIQTYIDKLDELLYSLTGDATQLGSGILLLTNDTMIQRTNSAFRQSGLVSSYKDALGRVFTEYKGALFVDMGRLNDDTTRVTKNTDALDGSSLTGGTGTSIYGVKLGPEYFTGWQMYPLEVTPPELDPVHKVTYTSVIDWYVGLALSHPRSAARLYGVIAA